MAPPSGREPGSVLAVGVAVPRIQNLRDRPSAPVAGGRAMHRRGPSICGASGVAVLGVAARPNGSGMPSRTGRCAAPPVSASPGATRQGVGSGLESRCCPWLALARPIRACRLSWLPIGQGASATRRPSRPWRSPIARSCGRPFRSPSDRGRPSHPIASPKPRQTGAPPHGPLRQGAGPPSQTWCWWSDAGDKAALYADGASVALRDPW